MHYRSENRSVQLAWDQFQRKSIEYLQNNEFPSESTRKGCGGSEGKWEGFFGSRLGKPIINRSKRFASLGPGLEFYEITQCTRNKLTRTCLLIEKTFLKMMRGGSNTDNEIDLKLVTAFLAELFRLILRTALATEFRSYRGSGSGSSRNRG